MNHCDTDGGPIDIEGLADLLHRRDIVSFVQQTMASYADDIPQPPAPLDTELARELVLFARRVAGRPIVAQNDDQTWEAGPEGYWYISPETSARLRILEEKARTLGAFHPIERLLALEEIRGRVADDLGAAASRDGVPTDRESLRSAILERQTPFNATERFLCDAFDEFCALLNSKAPLTAASLFQVHGRLSKMADSHGIQDNPVPTRWPEKSPFSFPPAQLGPGSLALPITSYELVGTDPLCAVPMISDSIWELKPFPSWNGIMEMMARTMTFSMQGLQPLALVPFSRLRLNWECGLDGCAEAFPYGRALVVSAYGIDSTPYLLQVIGMFEDGLERLKASVEAHDTSLAAWSSSLDSDLRLNLRQSQFLHEAIANETASIDVHDYGKRFDVTLSTARSDLNRLVSFGWLRANYEGKRQVFTLAGSI